MITEHSIFMTPQLNDFIHLIITYNSYFPVNELFYTIVRKNSMRYEKNNLYPNSKQTIIFIHEYIGIHR
ncbi:hypothetical protein V1478_017770 [Vespula squamosa]|uniref:Uncharacterized protein n=1 Tax=Vespula squamosa TaxID=30214 RepID=A0ABD1ZWS7_VESSQ